MQLENDYFYLTLHHNSLVALRGTMYHMSIILLEFQDLQLVKSTHVVYCELF